MPCCSRSVPQITHKTSGPNTESIKVTNKKQTVADRMGRENKTEEEAHVEWVSCLLGFHLLSPNFDPAKAPAVESSSRCERLETEREIPCFWPETQEEGPLWARKCGENLWQLLSFFFSSLFFSPALTLNWLQLGRCGVAAWTVKTLRKTMFFFCQDKQGKEDPVLGRVSGWGVKSYYLFLVLLFHCFAPRMP